VAYIGVGVNGRQLFLRAMDSLEATALPGTEGASDTVFFSPDGLSVAFLQGRPNVLKKVSIGGGLPVTLAATQGCGGDWGPDDQILIGRADGILQVPAGGGALKTLIAIDSNKGERGLGAPQLLPGGKSLLFSLRTDEGADIVAQRLATGERHTLVKGDGRDAASSARYTAGLLVYSQADGLMAAPFNIDRLELTGRAVPIVRAVGQIKSQFDLSLSGDTLVYAQSEPTPPGTLVWVDRKGTAESVGAPPGPYLSPSLSPDGSKVALAADSDIWVYELSRGTLTRFTFSGDNRLPVWTPDGKRITYVKNYKIAWNAVDRTTQEETFWTRGFAAPTSWTRDGKRLLITEYGLREQVFISVLSLEGDRKATPVVQSRFLTTAGVLSPDGRRLAYLSNESARYEIYVQEFPGPGGKMQISSQGGTEPVWGRQGRELFYRNGDKMMVVDIAPAPVLQAGTPRVLFEGRYNRNGTFQNYDVSADGQRFLMVKSGGAAPPVTQLNVILNWAGDVKRKAGAK
jgi:Tol biopolymer transport system component